MICAEARIDGLAVRSKMPEAGSVLPRVNDLRGQGREGEADLLHIILFGQGIAPLEPADDVRDPRTVQGIALHTQVDLPVEAVLQSFAHRIEGDDGDVAVAAVGDARFIQGAEGAEGHVVVLAVDHVKGLSGLQIL